MLTRRVLQKILPQRDVSRNLSGFFYTQKPYTGEMEAIPQEHLEQSIKDQLGPVIKDHMGDTHDQMYETGSPSPHLEPIENTYS